MISKTRAALLASALLVMPGMALAQSDVSDQANAVEETAEQLQEDANALGNVVTDDSLEATGEIAGDADDERDGDDDSGKWGLLGLLGLAGLLGLKRNDRDRDRDRDHRGSAGTTGSRTGTGTGTDTRL
jgi:MYXO-CTERM domain-containing protein